MKYVKKAQQILAKLLEAKKREGKLQLSPADWRIVGLALIEGKSINDNDFNAWKLENGFGKLSSNECSEALWLANDENWDFFSKPQSDKGWNVRAARRLKNELERDENGTYTTRILAFMQPKKVYTSDDVAEAVGLTSDRVSKRMYDLKKCGRVVSAGKAKYQLAPASMQKPVSKESSLTGTDIRNLFSLFINASARLHTLFRETAESSPYLKSMSPKASWEGGSLHIQTHPLSTTWKDGVESAKDVPEGCVGWAKGIRYRMTAEPVWVPVTEGGETREALAKRRAVK